MTEPDFPQTLQSNSEVDSTQLLETLRSLLPLGKRKIDLGTIEDVDRTVNRLAINFPKEQDDAIALQGFALIGLAIAKGSKEAAKRKPRPTRWLNDAPPSLQALLNDDERHAAVKLLAPLKASWVVSYAMREAADALTSKELVNDLVKWASAASATQADLVKGLSNVIRAYQTNSLERIKQVLKLGMKLLAASDTEAGARFADEFTDFASAVSDFCRSMDTLPETTAEMQGVALSLVEVISAREPAVLLAQSTLRGLVILSQFPGGWPKSLNKQLTSLSRRMLSTSLPQATMHGVDNSVEVKQLLRFAAQILPIEKVASRFMSDRDVVKRLLAPIEEEPARGAADVSVNSGIQEQVAALLLTWEAFRSGLADPASANEVGSLVALVASKAKVEIFGARGEVVSFQPLQHFLGDASTTLPANVRIEIPGVRAVRSDESYRVLTRALVYPVY